MENKKLLGKRIKEVRKARNITQEKLAELVNLETGSLSAIESGRKFPSLFIIEKIAQVLGVDLKLLFDYEHHLSDSEMELFITKNLNNLSSEQISFIYKFVKTYVLSHDLKNNNID